MKKKAVSKAETALLNAFWRALYPLNLFLFLVFIALSGSYVAMRFVEKIPLPQFLADIVKKEIESHGLIIDFDKAYLQIDEKIKLENLNLRFAGTPENFFKAKSVSLYFSWDDVLVGSFKIFGVEILSGRMSPSYGNIQASPFIEDMHVRVSHRGKWWNLEFLNFRSGQLTVSSAGVVSEDVNVEDFLDSALGREIVSSLSSIGGLVAGGKEEVSPKDAPSEDKQEAKESEKSFSSPALKLDMAFEKLAEIKKHVDKFSDPVLDVNFKIFGEDSNLNCVFSSGGRVFEIQLEDENLELQTRGLRIFAHINSGKNSYKGRWSIFAEEIFAPKYFDVSRVWMRSQVLPGGGNLSLKDFEISCGKIFAFDVELRNVSLCNEYLDLENYLEGWNFYANLGGEVFSASADFDEFWNSKIKLSGNLRPEIFMSLKVLKDIEELRECSFPNGIFVSANVDLNLKTFKCKLLGSVEAGECVVYRMPVKSAFSDLLFDSEKNIFLASNVIAKSAEGWKILGSFEQNFENMRYVINLDGNMRPMAIAHFMEEWWTDILGSVELGENNFISANARVEGAWGNPEHIWAFVGASGENGSYKGSRFDEFSLKIWVNPKRISLYDVELRSDNRMAHAVLEWLYGNEGITSYEKQKIFLESNLNSAELISLGGSDAREVLDVVQFSSAPRISLNALLRNPKNNSENIADIFNAHVFAAGKTRVADFATLENLRCFARSDVEHTQIEDASFQFCDGNGKGVLFLEKVGEKIKFDAEMTVKEMDQDTFEAFLRELGKDKKIEENTIANSEKPQTETLSSGDGLVLVQGRLKGMTDDPKSLEGSGFVAIENSKLIKFSILGALSRALESLNLPSGSFTLTYMHSPFEIKDGTVKFPKFEAGGSMARIKGAAAYEFTADNLNASLFIQPLGGVSAPIISGVFSMINPIYNLVEVKMTGPIDDPNTSVLINPVNVIRSDKKIIDNIRDSFEGTLVE